MIKLYFAPRTRSIRVMWLLEELGLPYEIIPVIFHPPVKGMFAQDTPTGKLPTIEDGELVMFESGAIIEYILERYGEGRLAPAIRTPERGTYLQWIHFSESAYRPIGQIVGYTRYRKDADSNTAAVKRERRSAEQGLRVIESAIAGKQFLVGDSFSAADIMMGFTLLAARAFEVLDATYPELLRYLDELLLRPALAKSLAQESVP